MRRGRTGVARAGILRGARVTRRGRHLCSAHLQVIRPLRDCYSPLFRQVPWRRPCVRQLCLLTRVLSCNMSRNKCRKAQRHTRNPWKIDPRNARSQVSPKTLPLALGNLVDNYLRRRRRKKKKKGRRRRIRYEGFLSIRLQKCVVYGTGVL